MCLWARTFRDTTGPFQHETEAAIRASLNNPLVVDFKMQETHKLLNISLLKGCVMV